VLVCVVQEDVNPHEHSSVFECGAGVFHGVRVVPIRAQSADLTARSVRPVPPRSSGLAVTFGQSVQAVGAAATHG
jgi:hypothetical protein